jgi:hypothetical protein
VTWAAARQPLVEVERSLLVEEAHRWVMAVPEDLRPVVEAHRHRLVVVVAVGHHHRRHRPRRTPRDHP